MYIYKITNRLNNKVYIGQTTKNVEKRFKKHLQSIHDKAKNTYPLYNSMRKYGKENFSIETLCECSTQLLLDSWERIYIERYNSTNLEKGYNIQLGGHGRGKMSDSTKEKLRQANLGKTKSLETLKKMSENRKGKGSWMKGKHHTEESKKKLSKAAKGKTTWMKGKTHSPEIIEKIKNGLKLRGKIYRSYSEETKLRKSKAQEKYSYLVVYPNGKEEQITNLTKFCRENNLSQGNMRQVYLGERQQHKGYKVRILE